MNGTYYLSRGYNAHNYKKCQLTKILSDQLKSIDKIDLFTLKFSNIIDFKLKLFEEEILDSTEEDIVISTYKASEDRLVPIFLKQLIFKEDIEVLDLDVDVDTVEYSVLAKKVLEYALKRKNNPIFVRYMVEEYLNKVESSFKNEKMETYKNGNLTLVKNTLDKPEILKSKDASFLYSIALENIFFNEIFFCEKKLLSKRGEDNQIIGYYKLNPKYNEVNHKRFHDFLIRVIDYAYKYEYEAYKERKLEESKDSEEEFMTPAEYNEAYFLDEEGYNIEDDNIAPHYRKH